ncbi:MAG: DUF423 domain-containing protein [Candidatus Competibacteraceae bacterium]|nr:DUF423 domain-containing protein [Candidatus Competibacteraceae bacterium]
MKRRFLIAGVWMALVATLFGALGAHAFKHHITAEQWSSFQTGIQYQFIHSLALIITGILYAHWPDKFVLWSGYLFLSGVLMFSGSIYLLATRDIIGYNYSFIGPITPLGGLMLMAGWISLLISLFRMKND